MFFPDESRLFVNDTRRQHIRVFDVSPDQTLSNSRVWASTDGDLPGVADGMKLDSAGNLYSSGSGGIHVFAPDATPLGVIRTPEVAANFTWGGENLIRVVYHRYPIYLSSPGQNTRISSIKTRCQQRLTCRSLDKVIMSTRMLNVSAESLTGFVAGIFMGAGCSEAGAQDMAECLVQTNLWGIDSHGVLRTPEYLKRFQSGAMNNQTGNQGA